ncbi:MmgE/PrpD family protein [Ramlibacter pinisoli]|nr:MmgE/PrpD family protein [Ramlibacter pinisoli]MBA2962378.1 MmgE/PrpD family protein [Ramlibacter sp. CGMCC 1.13660]
MQQYLDTSNSPPVTRLLARMIVNTRYEDLSPVTVKAAELALYDWVGCAMVSGQTEKAAKMARVAAAEGAQGGALVFADGKRTSPHWAAFANGASHAVELDDVHMASIIHGGIVICPTALSVAEQSRASGKKLIEGLVVGFDVAYRIGEAIAKTHYLMWHSTGTVATFGAAAAAAKIMGLDEDQTCWALGNAASQAAGIWEYLKFGDDTKLLHSGKAAMNGLLAASLAREGFTGSDTGIEGERGFLATMSGSSNPAAVNWDAMTRDLGKKFKVDENGYKLHACCRHGHVSIDNALRLIQQHGIRADQVKAVRVQMNRNSCDTLGDSDPVSPYKAKFSLAFFMATCFLHRKVGMEAFTDDRLRDPAMRAFMKKVSYLENPEYTRNYPRLWTASLEVELQDGQVLSTQGDLPYGDPATELPIPLFEQKALDMMGSVVGADRARGLLAAMQQLPEVGDVSRIFDGYPYR